MEKKVYEPYTIYTKDMTPDQIIFWNKLSNAVDENGNPFFFQARKHSAHINQEIKIHAGGKYALILEYVPRIHEFRIAIYIADSTQSRVWRQLLSQRETINAELNLPEKYRPIWCAGEKNPNTKRIQTVLPLFPDTDRDELIDEALPIIMRYIKVFPKFLPDLFCITVR